MYHTILKPAGEVYANVVKVKQFKIRFLFTVPQKWLRECDYCVRIFGNLNNILWSSFIIFVKIITHVCFCSSISLQATIRFISGIIQYGRCIFNIAKPKCFLSKFVVDLHVVRSIDTSSQINCASKFIRIYTSDSGLWDKNYDINYYFP